MLIIAEIGENHLGNMEIARDLLKKAAESDVDYVKFQSYKPENFRVNDPERKWFRKVFLSDERHFMLKEHATRCGVKFLSSPFSVERARFLCEKLGLKEIKIASGVMQNLPLLDYVNKNVDTVFLSTGMATVTEIKRSVARLNKVRKCYILHCVAQYPCKDKETNLLAIKGLQKEFPDYEIGYSDHTTGYWAAIAAAALGAKVIEKHFTFDKTAKEGTDHILSVDPDELKEMVSGIRRVALMLGKEKKEPTGSERGVINFVRNRFI